MARTTLAALAAGLAASSCTDVATGLAASSCTAAPVANFTQTYSDGSCVFVGCVSADGSILRITSAPAGGAAPYARFPLEVPQPPLPAGSGLVVQDNGGYVLLTTPSLVVNVSKTQATASVLRASDGTVLSHDLAPPSIQPESQCGNGHGGPIAGGCVRASRSLQYNEKVWGYGMQFASGPDQTLTTKFIRTCANPDDTGL